MAFFPEPDAGGVECSRMDFHWAKHGWGLYPERRPPVGSVEMALATLMHDIGSNILQIVLENVTQR